MNVTLDYSPSIPLPLSTARSVAVFAPGLLAVAVLSACANSSQRNLVAIVAISTMSVAESLTIVFLLVWRRRIHLAILLAGWLVAVSGGLFLVLCLGMWLGLIDD